MRTRRPLPPPVFTPEERGEIDGAIEGLRSAFLAVGMERRRDGFPFRQHRDASARQMLVGTPRGTWLRNHEHAGLLLEFSRLSGDASLYARIPYACVALNGVDPVGVRVDRLCDVHRQSLELALAVSAEFVRHGRTRLLEALGNAT